MISDDLPSPHLPVPPPLISLPPPPAAVTEAATTLRVGCATWAPHPGSYSSYKAELQACDVVLNRDGEFAVGVFVGLTAAFAFVWFVSACRHCVRDRAFSKADQAMLYTAIVFLGGIGGIIVGFGVIRWFGDDWSSAQTSLAFGGCGFVVTGLLAALRWHKHRGVAA